MPPHGIASLRVPSGVCVGPSSSSSGVVEDFLRCFTASAAHRGLNPDCTVGKYLRAADAPGPRSLPFRERHVLENIADRPYWYVHTYGCHTEALKRWLQ